MAPDVGNRTLNASIATPLEGRTVLKMDGLGNQIVVLDLRGSGHVVTAAEARAIGRMPGLKFDQLMVLHDPRRAETEAFVLIYNIDGSEAGACGNGTRCVAWLIATKTGKADFAVETKAGLLACARMPDGQYSVDMGTPRLCWDEIPLSEAIANTSNIPIDTGFLDAGWPGDFAAVSMGNPHAIFFVDDVEGHDLARTGPLMETHPLFPERANISLVSVTSDKNLIQKVWERGAGLTLACGSGACAAAVAAHRRGLVARDVSVMLPGGALRIVWRDDGGVTMTGPVNFGHEQRLVFATADTPT